MAPAAAAFPTWRKAWEALEDIPPLLRQADALLRRRARGNDLLPKIDESWFDEQSGIALEAVRRWTDGQPPKKVHERPAIAKSILARLSPLLRAAAWPRWLFLERALLDGSNTGDLLFSAVVIRTMCEEVQKLIILDLDPSTIEALAASTDRENCSSFMLFLRTVRVTLDKVSDPREYDPPLWRDLDWGDAGPRGLQAAKQALNDYLHPNYGSHVVALFPERAAAASVLLEGMIAAYDAFFSLSWAEQPLQSLGQSLGVAPTKSWLQTVRHFTKRVAPKSEQQALRGQAGEAENFIIEKDAASIFRASATAAWLTERNTQNSWLLNEPGFSDLVETLKLPVEKTRGKMVGENLPYQLWEGATESDVVYLAFARRAEQQLIEAFPLGAPQKSDQALWLNFQSLALQLAMLIDCLKVECLKSQLVRQIVVSNPLGILLCVRSLVEHQAASNWLVGRLGIQWAEIGKRVKPGRELPDQARIIEEALGKYLAGSKGSVEAVLPWATREIEGKWAVQMSLPDIVEGAFEASDRFKTIYAIASAALHGRTFRGLELLQRAKTEVSPVAELGIVVLERLCGSDEREAVMAQALLLHTKLNHASMAGGTAAAASDAQVQGAFGHFGGKLKSPRDYTGDGSKENPFRFRPHLHFLQASDKLLEQMEILPTGRRLDVDPSGRPCDCYQAAGRTWWFVLPIPSSE